jgi:outer membrane biosynthesis protein TonB
MPASERHALEKAALEDPFLGDALEGYVHMANADADAAELKKRLAVRLQKEPKVVPFGKKNSFHWLRIAAMFFVLLGAGWGVFELSKGRKEDIALNQQETKAAAKDDSSGPMPAPVESIDASADQEKNDVANNPAASQATTESIEAPATSGNVSKSKKNITTRNETSDLKREVDETKDISTALSGRISGVAADSATGITSHDVASRKAPVKLFQGRVVDINGAPLPYVNISAETRKVATTTDLNGNFSLQAADTTLKASVSLVGFETRQAFLNAPSQNTVVLKESASSLNEVVVTGYGQQRKRAARKQIIESGELEPTEGWQRFDEYVTRNLKVPDDVKEKPPSGEVALSFDIDKGGEPVNIKVDKSLCTVCDEEAVRLLKEGPTWKKKKGKRGKVKIRF